MTSVEASWMGRIVATPNILHGQTRIKGTRIPIKVVLDNLATGTSWEEIIEDYPPLSEEDIKAVLLYTSHLEDKINLISGEVIKPHHAYSIHPGRPYSIVFNNTEELVARDPAAISTKSIAHEKIGIITKFSQIINKDTINDKIDKLLNLMSEEEEQLRLTDFISRILFIYACGNEYEVTDRVLGVLIKKFYKDIEGKIREFGRIKSNEFFLIDGKYFIIQEKGMEKSALQLLKYLDRLK